MKISFVWDWPVTTQTPDWQDGLSAALNELKRRGHEVDLFVAGDYIGTVHNRLHDITVTPDIPGAVRDINPDVILCWADTTRQNAKPLAELGKPMALCFAGGNPLGETYPFFDHIFVESEVYKKVYDEAGVPCSIAFGTNTDLFAPIPDQPKLIDAIFPATFAAWKRHHLFANAVQGLRSLACGYIYDSHEQECWQECQRLGTTILPHVSAEVLKYLYASSKVCVITSSSAGGSQRTVLEAMAMNLPLIVTDSDKYDYLTDECFRVAPEIDEIRGAVKAVLDGARTVNTRQHVIDNWSHFKYADALEAGLESLL